MLLREREREIMAEVRFLPGTATQYTAVTQTKINKYINKGTKEITNRKEKIKKETNKSCNILHLKNRK